MKNSKNGVTFMILVIVIVVMGILVGITAMSTKGMIKESDARKFATELKQIEYLVKEYEKINGNTNFKNFEKVDIDVNNMPYEQRVQMESEVLTDGNIVLYELDFKELNIMDTVYGKKQKGDDDVYVVSYDTGNVYYLKGYKWNGVTYYKLTGELDKLVSGFNI